jgi:hypothetical protein
MPDSYFNFDYYNMSRLCSLTVFLTATFGKLKKQTFFFQIKMLYSQSNSVGYDYYNGSSESGCILAIIIFGSFILFFLVVILITICWICCRKDNCRDGIVIHPMTQPHHGESSLLDIN